MSRKSPQNSALDVNQIFDLSSHSNKYSKASLLVRQHRRKVKVAKRTNLKCMLINERENGINTMSINPSRLVCDHNHTWIHNQESVNILLPPAPPVPEVTFLHYEKGYSQLIIRSTRAAHYRATLNFVSFC